MKQLLAASLVFVLVYGCGNSEEGSTESAIESIDSTVEELVDTPEEPEVEIGPISDHLQTILNKSPESFTSPVVIDTNFVEEIDLDKKTYDDALSYENVNYLAAECIENLPTINASYILTSFCMIDSLRAGGEYEDYVSSLDIGMMQNSDAYVEGLVEIDPLQKLLIWSVTYSTYEACPYASGTVLFGTYLYNNEVKNALVLAEVSGGGDPPYWSETFVSSEISETLIETSVLERSNDYDEELGDEKVISTEGDYSVTIESEGLKAPPLLEY